jgi:ribulose-5-phosphate 4-epimerase/fuculose-1-phosphate aldolase
LAKHATRHRKEFLGVKRLFPSTTNQEGRGMSSNGVLKFKSLRDQVSEAEWEARVALAACYRLVARYGMADMIYTHITARVPGSPDQFLINSYGLLFEEMTASSLYKIDHEGNVILKPDTHYGTNYPGFVIHSAIHKARPEVNCVLHTHTRAGMAVSAMKCGLLPLTQHAMSLYGRVAYHDYEGPAVNLEERERLARDLGAHPAMILRNHGLLTCSETIQQAFNMHYLLEMSCKAQVDAMAANTELQYPDQEIMERTAHQFNPEVRRPYGIMEWEALTRLLDCHDPSYRD